MKVSDMGVVSSVRTVVVGDLIFGGVGADSPTKVAKQYILAITTLKEIVEAGGQQALEYGERVQESVCAPHDNTEQLIRAREKLRRLERIAARAFERCSDLELCTWSYRRLPYYVGVGELELENGEIIQSLERRELTAKEVSRKLREIFGRTVKPSKVYSITRRLDGLLDAELAKGGYRV